MFIIIFFGAHICVAQKNEFSFKDKSFRIGATKTILSNLYCIPLRCTCENDTNGLKTFDSIGNFLKLNPKIILEIACHTETLIDSEYAAKLSEMNAANLRKEIINEYKLDSNCIISKGLGSLNPIISKQEIEMIPSSFERSKADKYNSRTVLTIIKINNKKRKG